MTRTPYFFALSVAFGLGCSHSNDAGTSVEDARIDDVNIGDIKTDETSPAFVCARGSKVDVIPTTCNGAAALCDRGYDHVTTAMTHNAMSNADDHWAAPNQGHGLARQLQDGIRGMMLDVHYYDPESGSTDARRDDLAPLDQVYLCHGVCSLGRRPLAEGLCDVAQFLDQNRGEVLSIIFESYVTSADLAAVVTASGLTDYVTTHVRGTPWPTLRELISKNQRLVVFTEDGDDSPAWNHSAWKNIQDTPYSFTAAADFTCKQNRGAKTNPLFLVNHWLGNPLSDIKYAREVNVKGVLLGRVQQCTKEVGMAPTFIGVDFYDVGDLFEVVRITNGL